MAVTPDIVPLSTYPPREEYIVVIAKVPVVLVDGGFVIPLTVMLNVWAAMFWDDELRLLKVIELSIAV